MSLRWKTDKVARACKAAISALKNGAGAVEGVEAAIKILEDDGITNSGYGSNLTCEGRVECDASIMDNAGRSGAVGASSCKSSLITLDCQITSADQEF